MEQLKSRVKPKADLRDMFLTEIKDMQLESINKITEKDA